MGANGGRLSGINIELAITNCVIIVMKSGRQFGLSTRRLPRYTMIEELHFGTRGGEMSNEAIAKALDEVENALIRAVEAKKDIDIVVALRAIEILMTERLKNGSQ